MKRFMDEQPTWLQQVNSIARPIHSRQKSTIAIVFAIAFAVSNDASAEKPLSWISGYLSGKQQAATVSQPPNVAQRDPQTPNTYASAPALPQAYLASAPQPTTADTARDNAGIAYSDGLIDSTIPVSYRSGRPPAACDAYPTLPTPPYVPQPPATYCDAPPPQPVVRQCAPPCPPKPHVHHVYLPQNCPQPEEPAELPAETQRSLPPGSFVAPPRSGTVVKESSAMGITGFRLRFPEWEISLPSIELPTFIRRERGARMELDRGLAPYVASANGQAATVQNPNAAMIGSPCAAQYQAAMLAQYAAHQQRAQQHRPVAQAANIEKPQQAAAEIDDEVQALKERCEKLEQLLLQTVECQRKAIEGLQKSNEGS